MEKLERLAELIRARNKIDEVVEAYGKTLRSLGKLWMLWTLGK